MSDKQIKRQATRKMMARVFNNFGSGDDIVAECNDGMWIRRYWRNPNGNFGWDRWERIS